MNVAIRFCLVYETLLKITLGVKTNTTYTKAEREGRKIEGVRTKEREKDRKRKNV